MWKDIHSVNELHSMRKHITIVLLFLANMVMAGTGKWESQVTGTLLNYTTFSATTTAATDINGKPMTVVYLENLGFQKIGQNSNAGACGEDV